MTRVIMYVSEGFARQVRDLASRYSMRPEVFIEKYVERIVDREFKK